jgi:O-antigen ligase
VLSHNNADVTQYIKTYLHLLFLSSFTVALAFFPVDNKTVFRIIKIWLIISIFVNIFGIYQLFARAFDLPFGWIELTNASLTHSETETYQQLSLKFKNFYRATSIFSEPSALAGYNLIIIGFLMFPMFEVESFKIFKSKKFINFIFILSAIALFVTFSLTGLLGLAVLFMGYFVFSKKISIKKLFRILLIVALSIVAVDALIEIFFDTSVLGLFYTRIASILGITNKSIVGESFGTRSDNFFYSLRTWISSPLIGVGLGQTKYFSKVLYSDYAILHALMETGIFGGLAFALLFISTVAEFLVLRKSFNLLNQAAIYLINSGFFVLCVLIITNLATSNSFIGFYLWSLMGIVFIIITNAKKELGYDTKPIWLYKSKAPSEERALK